MEPRVRDPLTAVLASLRLERTFVLAIGRSGVRRGESIARSLHAPLDVVMARKVSLHDGVGLPIGAVAAGGVRIVDPAGALALGLDDEAIGKELDRAADELEREAVGVRGAWPLPDLTGRTVILIDDAAVSGLTMAAAAAAVRDRAAAHLIAALPMASEEAIDRIATSVHELVVVERLASSTAAERHARAQLEASAPPDDDEIHDLLTRRLRELGSETALPSH